MNIDSSTTTEVHGLDKGGLDNIRIDGERVRWCKRQAFPLWANPAIHGATAFGLTAHGTTRHSALNKLLKAIHLNKLLKATHERKNDMPASKDRVKFRIPKNMFDSDARMRSLLGNTLGIKVSEYEDLLDQAQHFGYAMVICRPSQFARFLIERNRLGFTNSFKDLEAELFVPEASKPVQKPMDVSRNPA